MAGMLRLKASMSANRSNNGSSSGSANVREWSMKDFIIEGKIKGDFGTVMKARVRETGEKITLKCFNETALKKARCLNLMQREIGNLNRVKGHPNIVEVLGSFKEKEETAFIIERLYETLEFRLARESKLEEGRAASYLFQLCRAVYHLHNSKPHAVIHRDIQPGAIYLTEDNKLKLGDFGLSIQAAGTRGTICGTYKYMAPEVFKGPQEHHTTSADIWSLGIVLHEMVSGKLPFPKEYNETSIMKCPVRIQSSIKGPLKDLLCGILQQHQDNRLSVEGIAYHPWIPKDISQVGLKVTLEDQP